MSLAEWNLRAEKRLRQVLARALKEPALRRAVKLLPGAEFEAEVMVVGTARMKAMNARFRRKRHATDVLSFPAPGIFQRTGFLGEIVVCSVICARQAREQGHSRNCELEVLLVHGVLHLLGFDHEKSARDAGSMARWEVRLLGASKTEGLTGRK